MIQGKKESRQLVRHTSFNSSDAYLNQEQGVGMHYANLCNTNTMVQSVLMRDASDFVANG